MPIINTIYGGGANGSSSKKPILFQITLQPNEDQIKTNWTDYSKPEAGGGISKLKKQVVKNENFKTNGYCYLVSPSQEDYNTYIEYGTRGLDVITDGEMEFVCYGDRQGKAPSLAIKVDILRMEDEYAEEVFING